MTQAPNLPRVLNWHGIELVLPAELPPSASDAFVAQPGDEMALLCAIRGLLGPEQWAKARQVAVEQNLPADEFNKLMHSVLWDAVNAGNNTFANELRVERQRNGDTPVAIDGSRSKGAELGYFQTSLRDGTAGYFQRRADDCLQAVIASCAQIPPHLCPDFRIDEQLRNGVRPEHVERTIWARLASWAARLGLRVVIHPVVPRYSRRWIGIIDKGAGAFNDHSLLMRRRECLFDPTTRPGGEQEDLPDISHCDWAITIERN